MLGALGYLGALTAARQAELFAELEPHFRIADALEIRINDIAGQGTLPTATVQGMRDQRDALREQLDQMHTQIQELESGDDIIPWSITVRHLGEELETLSRTVRALGVAAVGAQAWKIGLWTGAAVAGAIGVGLLVRHFGSRVRRYRGSRSIRRSVTARKRRRAR